MEAFFMIIILLAFLFIVTHLRPLNDKEMKNLSDKRRGKAIRQYFHFDPQEYNVDKDFKKRMNPNGKFYGISEDLYCFPAIAAGLLKYKKHEWVIIAFEKDKKVTLAWLNKGFDGSCVNMYLSPYDMIDVASKEGYTSVIIFHNHPNSNPHHLDCSKPSKQDIASAKEISSTLCNSGVNLLEFICERGRHYQYFIEVSDMFLPMPTFLEVVKAQNGNSRLGNLSLHLARFF